MWQKILLITLLLILFPLLLKIGFFIFLFFLALIPICWIAGIIIRNKIQKNIQNMYIRTERYSTNFKDPYDEEYEKYRNTQSSNDIIIDVKAQRKD